MLSVLWNGNSISTFACQETLPPGACSKPKGSRSVTRPVPFVCGRRWPHVARICPKHKGTWGQNNYHYNRISLHQKSQVPSKQTTRTCLLSTALMGSPPSTDFTRFGLIKGSSTGFKVLKQADDLLDTAS